MPVTDLRDLRDRSHSALGNIPPTESAMQKRLEKLAEQDKKSTQGLSDRSKEKWAPLKPPCDLWHRKDPLRGFVQITKGKVTFRASVSQLRPSPCDAAQRGQHTDASKTVEGPSSADTAHCIFVRA